MTLKPFNLEEAVAGKPLITRDGKKVIELYHFKTTCEKICLIASIEGILRSYDIDGKYYFDNNNLDLFMADEEKEMCVICNKNEKFQESPHRCIECRPAPTTDQLVILAKRIKALEEKLNGKN